MRRAWSHSRELRAIHPRVDHESAKPKIVTFVQKFRGEAMVANNTASRNVAVAETGVIASWAPSIFQTQGSAPPGSPIGASAQWRTVMRLAHRVAATDATTCLLGESGTGKEVIARFIHQQSSRRRGPFIALNCAALPEQLLESELFGFERGAFTGAQQSKPGL